MPRFQKNIATIAFVGVVAGVSYKAWQRPDDLIQNACVGVVVYLIVLLVAAFDWSIYTSESPRVSAFFFFGPVVSLLLTAAVAVSLVNVDAPSDVLPKEDPIEHLPARERDEISHALKAIVYPKARSQTSPVEAPKPRVL